MKLLIWAPGALIWAWRGRRGHQVGSRPYLIVRCSSLALCDRNYHDLRRGNSGISWIRLNFHGHQQDRVPALAAWSMMSWGGGRGRGVVPTQGGDCYSTPLGWLESMGFCFQKLGRSSKASIYYLLAGALRDLRGFARDADVQGRSRADEYSIWSIAVGSARHWP